MSEQLPTAVAEAQRVVDRFARTRAALAIGPMLMAILTIGSVGLGYEGLAVPGVIGMLLTIAVTIALVTSQQEQVRSARRLLDEVERQRLRETLGPPVAAPAAQEPDDPRWAPARVLLARVAELGADLPRIAEVTAGTEARLRALLRDVAILGEAVEADRALGEDPRHDRLTSVRARKEEQVTALIASLRDLHAGLAAREAGAEDPVGADLGDLLQRVAADVETSTVASDAADDERRRATSAEPPGSSAARRAAAASRQGVG